MRITSISITPNFEARIKIKAPDVQKLKKASVESMNKPEAKKVLASSGVSLAGTASILSASCVDPNQFQSSVESVTEVQDNLFTLGTTVSEIPLFASLVGLSNDLSGTNSSASLEEFLFDKLAREKSTATTKEKLGSLKKTDNDKKIPS